MPMTLLMAMIDSSRQWYQVLTPRSMNYGAMGKDISACCVDEVC